MKWPTPLASRSTRPRSPSWSAGRPTDDGSRPPEKGCALGTPAQRRQYLQQFNRERPEGFSVARGCRAMKLARSTYHYLSRPLLGGVENPHRPFIGVPHRMVHEHVAPGLSDTEFEDRSIARAYFEALEVMERVSWVAALIDSAE